MPSALPARAICPPLRRDAPGSALDAVSPTVQARLYEVIAPVPSGPQMSEEDRALAAERYTIIEPLLKRSAFPELWSEAGGKRGKLIELLAQRHPKAQRSTIFRWLKAFKDRGVEGLVNRDRSDKGKPRVLNQAALAFLVRLALPEIGQYGKLSVRDIYRAYLEEREWRDKRIGKKLSGPEADKYAIYLDANGNLSPDAAFPEASYHTFVYWFNHIPSLVKTMAREGREAFANTQEIISFRNIAAVAPMEYVVMDHRQLDLFCMVRSGNAWKLIRPWLTAAIDMRTRKWLGWVFVQTPSSDSIAATLKKVFLGHGLPQAVYWDNGKDFRCRWLEGTGGPKEEVARVGDLEAGFRGVLDALGIRVHHAIVKRARSKIIEPNFGRTAKFDRIQPWWCGHNPQARPESLETLLKRHDLWIKGEYKGEAPFPELPHLAEHYGRALEMLNERPMENADGMRKIVPGGYGWMCPNEAWEKLIPGVAIRKAPEDIIHICFTKRRENTVRHAELKVTLGGRIYHYRAKQGQMSKLAMLNDRKVEIAYDPLDLETVAIYNNGSFVCLASNVELRRMGEQGFVDDERFRRALERDTKALIDAVHSGIPIVTPEERLRRAEVVPRRKESGNEAPFEAPPEIAAAARAYREDKLLPAPVTVQKVQSKEAEQDDAFNFFS